MLPIAGRHTHGPYAEQVGRAEEPRSGFTAGKTIAERLSELGYLTFMVGKHHGTDNPLDFGFDRYSGLRDGSSNHFNPGIVARPGEPEPARKGCIYEGGRWFCFDRDCQRGWTPDDPDYYSTDSYTDWALEYLDEASEFDDPFFLYLSYQAPHDPCMPGPTMLRAIATVIVAATGRWPGRATKNAPSRA